MQGGENLSLYHIGLAVGEIFAIVALLLGIYVLVHFIFVKFPASELFWALQDWRRTQRRNRGEGLLRRGLSKLKNALDFTTQDTEHAGMALVGPLTFVLGVRFLVQWGDEQQAWHRVLSSAWDSLWFWAGVTALVFLWISFLRKLPPLDEKFMRFCRSVVVAEGILLIFSPWLLYMGEQAFQEVHAPSISLPAQKSANEFAPGVSIKDGTAYATLTGREENGLTVLQMPPQSSYQVCYVKGEITTYQPHANNNSSYEIWGDPGGYVVHNQWGTLDWRANYRYAAFTGVLPQAVIVVVGHAGNEENVVPFAPHHSCADVQNASDRIQPLVLSYNAMEFYVERPDGYIFPNEQAAAGFGSAQLTRHNGWQDQGKDGSTETFAIRPVLSR